MTLLEYFLHKPRGSRQRMARELGLSVPWFSMLTHARAKPSAGLCVRIEQLTHGQVTRAELRPDLFK